MTDYITSDTDLTAVADAIRAKGGTSAALEWPGGFSSAIADIPSGGTDFIVTLTQNQGGDIVPTCTFAEIQAAHNAGKNIVIDSDWQNTGSTADGYYDYNSDIFVYAVSYESGWNEFRIVSYMMDANGVTVDHETTTILPSGSQTITENDDYDVTNLASVTVNVPTGLQIGVLRPDAELVQTWSYDKYINADEGVEIPAYTTTATPLKATENLTPTATLAFTNYNYYVLERFLAIPEYNVETKGKGRTEYWLGANLYEVTAIEGNTLHSLIDTSKFATSRTLSVNVSGFSRLVYWSSTSALTAYASAAYGVYETATAPTLSGTTLTMKSPVLGIRGHTSYFTNTYFNALTDVRYQWRIELWRAPKGNLNLDGWGLAQNFMKAYEAIDASDHTLN